MVIGYQVLNDFRNSDLKTNLFLEKSILNKNRFLIIAYHKILIIKMKGIILFRCSQKKIEEFLRLRGIILTVFYFITFSLVSIFFVYRLTNVRERNTPRTVPRAAMRWSRRNMEEPTVYFGGHQL